MPHAGVFITGDSSSLTQTHRKYYRTCPKTGCLCHILIINKIASYVFLKYQGAIQFIILFIALRITVDLEKKTGIFPQNLIFDECE